jgi:hypothetical protein
MRCNFSSDMVSGRQKLGGQVASAFMSGNGVEGFLGEYKEVSDVLY